MIPFNLIGAAKQNQLKVEYLTALTSSQALRKLFGIRQYHKKVIFSSFSCQTLMKTKIEFTISG